MQRTLVAEEVKVSLMHSRNKNQKNETDNKWFSSIDLTEKNNTIIRTWFGS